MRSCVLRQPYFTQRIRNLVFIDLPRPTGARSVLDVLKLYRVFLDLSMSDRIGIEKGDLTR
jgi:hypothetical protein